MPIVIFRERGEALYAYIAKQDLRPGCSRSNMTRRTAGAARLPSEGGRRYYVNPQPGRPVFPISLRATRSTLL
ncbi:putative nitrogen fixation protein NifT [Klebsiella variicola subsp. variicola]|nr:putative nitrogen fixation protein NifT [Klebsiella variicola subsp. variicola]